MILTTCAACAAPLAHDAPRCVRCQMRYCNQTCQHDHWRRGHKQMCKKIHRGGNAEQYHADKKYKEAVAVAVEVCADDTKGQTCFICTDALHWKTKEGLVRGCACRGTGEFVHVSCLAEHAKLLVADGEANHLNSKAMVERWARWTECSLCKQQYHGVVAQALGWACWKTYLGRPEDSGSRMSAMKMLGEGLISNTREREALVVYRALMGAMERLDYTPHERSYLFVQERIAFCLETLGHIDECLAMRRAMHDVITVVEPDSATWCASVINLSEALMRHHRVVENMKFMRSIDSPVARKDNGITVEIMLRIMFCYAKSVYLYHFIGADGYNDEYLRSISMFRDIGTRAVELLGEDSELSDEVAECHAEAISFRLE